MAFRNHVRRFRKTKGLTQDELAKLAGVSRVTIGHVESGRIEPTADTMFRLAEVLDVTVHDLFERVEGEHNLATRVVHVAADLAKGIATTMLMGVVIFFGVLAYTEARADWEVSRGEYQDAQLNYFAANTLLHPFVVRARLSALHSAQSLNIGLARGYLSPLPSVAACRQWLNDEIDVAKDSQIDDVLGNALHAAAADCLDRVHASGEAYDERLSLVRHPSYLLARSEAMDFYAVLHAAVEAAVMHDSVNAKRLAELARTEHPALYKQWISRWGNPRRSDPLDVVFIRNVMLDRKKGTTLDD